MADGDSLVTVGEMDFELLFVCCESADALGSCSSGLVEPLKV